MHVCMIEIAVIAEHIIFDWKLGWRVFQLGRINITFYEQVLCTKNMLSKNINHPATAHTVRIGRVVLIVSLARLPLHHYSLY